MPMRWLVAVCAAAVLLGGCGMSKAEALQATQVAIQSLVGSTVTLNDSTDTVMVLPDEAAMTKFFQARDTRDISAIGDFAFDERIVFVKKGTRAEVLEARILDGSAVIVRVRILDGEERGREGWVRASEVQR